ncbi:hypothetical protein ACFVUN_09605 [Kitasatospora griseola]|uniref:hypothetical protein n=1 Tax=Kitasatospora griseola TaxID=2064 RepID=UPI0036DEBEA7
MSDSTTSAPVEEPTHAWLITLQYATDRGFAVATRHGNAVIAPGRSREQAYIDLRDTLARCEPELRGASVLFFSLEPYRL